MDGNSQLSVPSNSESPLMCEVSTPQQGGASGSSGSSLGSSITACKKVLRSNSLLESTDYWLQNQRTPCQIAFLEDKCENTTCASVCFVNLDVNKDESTTEHLQQKLVNVSPDLPKLINSMNVQQPKENEIVLLSGLTSGNLQTDFEVSQCPWMPDICLVQCARGNRPNSTNCIIFEINKFLIGLELVQERQLHLETNILKVEDDTNCSLSSIEEDFLTASEHLEEESEVEEYRNGCENINLSANVMESKKPKETTQEEWDYNKEKSLNTLEDKYISKYHASLIKTEGSLEKGTEDTTLQSLDPSINTSEWKREPVGNDRSATNYYYSEKCKGQMEKLQALYIPGNAYFSRVVKKDGPSACGTLTEHGNSLDAGDHEDATTSLLPIQDGKATTGEYATNLAESVLQDAFIRLSQSQPTLPQESVVSVSVGSTPLSSGCSTKDIVAPRSWNELPKIVIVQSPDGSDAAPEPGISTWPEMELSVETSGVPSRENSSRHPQSALEVALACAATVIGTISSPKATERLKMEQEALVSNHPLGDREPRQTPASQVVTEPSINEYSFPSALCGMTQVASAVAVCGLGETGEVKYPVVSSGLLSAAESSAATPPLCNLVTGKSMELGNEAIAEALLNEATLVLTRPNTYSSIGDLMESITRRIMETASKPQTLCSENVLRNELAQALSSVILKHAIDEVHQTNKIIDHNNGRHTSETLDTLMESTNQLLFSVICCTFKKMSHLAQLSECPTIHPKETIGWRETDLSCQPPDQAAGQARTKATECSSHHPLSNAHSTSPVINEAVDNVHPKQDSKGPVKPGLFQSPTLQSELSCSPRVPGSSTAKTSPEEIYLKGTMAKDTKNPHQVLSHNESGCRASSEGEWTPTASKCNHGSQDAEDGFSPNTQEKYSCVSPLRNELQVSLSLLENDLPLPAQSVLQAQHTDAYCITDFAEELAETIVSMATEIAAICLDNSNGKQPWFCAWKRGNEFLVTPNVSCRSLKRKESQAGGATVRKHKPPRLSEIKRKTDEHPELKEKLMNRVVDESMNLEDVPDSVNIFANEVAAKIMNLTEFSMVDGVWQAQSFPRNRLHSGDRWNRLKASSCESIAEEDSDARAYVNGLGLMSTLSQPVSRASSVSKQSSCESITDEFSRFMVNQMENEGRGFELLLDYYAGKNASSILNSAMQQACRKHDHLSVRPSCPSKQSSTESITEEFYRYMLKDVERDGKDSASSRRSSQDWTAGFLSPSLRSPLCYRQSSMPDGRSLGARLTVNAPFKANSLDGFAQNSQRDFLSVQPVSSASSSGLCKSDSCLYRRGGTDHITTMLIHETWANSIEALMRKNKIIMDDAQAAEAEPVSRGSPLQLEKGANRLPSSKVQSGPILLVQESIDYPRKDSITRSQHPPESALSKDAPLTKHNGFDSKKETPLCHDGVPLNYTRRPLCSREVPLIQIETDQREECVGEPEHILSKSSPLEEAAEHLKEEMGPDVARGGDAAESARQNCSNSLEARDIPEAEVSTEGRAIEEVPNPPGSSGESTDSWSQLANEEDNPDDTSSFLQLSERSMRCNPGWVYMSNGNSSATSSLGIMDLDIYQESMPPSPMIHELVEEKEILKGQSENMEEFASGAPAGAASRQGSLLVINFDLEPERPDAELRAMLQWIAASELGIPTIYFKKSQENRIEKFLDVVRLVHQKSWKVGDIFHAVVQYCKMHEQQKDGTPSLFDWLLELG
ncbi:PREDICTED: A-kinase anchor protein SPHKAP isoform X3 [Hipposideros armiger]|uniref:A-kinase anchor protein SPHKAP isoform X3 n=1 Tax=Hipposideros armiger TaxID=186990 RepID=A0A8B7SH45_HIPAR|nr:PREDICTED: A-kinase anchor protein SPHKAP isoform X3 [Hipposideros armiger]